MGVWVLFIAGIIAWCVYEFMKDRERKPKIDRKQVEMYKREYRSKNMSPEEMYAELAKCQTVVMNYRPGVHSQSDIWRYHYKSLALQELLDE